LPAAASDDRLYDVTIEYIRYRIPTASGDEFQDAYRRAGRVLATAPECVDYELSRCEEDPEYFVLRIGWTSTRDHLDGFRRSAAFAEFFACIKPYVDDIEEMRHYEPTPVTGHGGAVPTPYEWAGGTEAFERLCDAFYAKVFTDELLSPLFAGVGDEHVRHVAAWLAEIFGGPTRYSARYGGHATMAVHHAGRAITEQQRRHWMNLLIDTADEIGLPTDPEFRATFVSYLEWGTRMAVLLSQPGADPGTDAPMPTWTWVRPPWRG
jgi:hemoglobin